MIWKHMAVLILRLFLLPVILVLASATSMAGLPVREELHLVRVGIFENEPMQFMDKNGRPAGIFVEILAEIARQEGVELVYLPCDSIDACFRMLENGDVDILPSIAFSPQRAERFSYHWEKVIESWAHI
jgi:ABC-type amino acid transport substrate-binding protein